MRLRVAATRPRHAAPVLLAADALADGLGYVVGAGSLLLYTPIATRMLRTSSAGATIGGTGSGDAGGGLESWSYRM